MKILFDINVVLDVLLARAPWVAAAQELWLACDEGRIEGYLAAVSLPTIFYVIRKAAGPAKARDAVRVCLDAFDICPVDQKSLEAAFALPGPDFEDNLQVACAAASRLDSIVSRDPRGLANPHVRVLTPADVVALV